MYWKSATAARKSTICVHGSRKHDRYEESSLKHVTLAPNMRRVWFRHLIGRDFMSISPLLVFCAAEIVSGGRTFSCFLWRCKKAAGGLGG